MKKCNIRKLIFILPLFFSSLFVFGQNIEVRGIVTDAETGEALIGVSVIQKGTTNGMMTGIDGNYSLSVPQGATLQFSFVGYITHETPANSTSVNVQLRASSEYLDEVVVIGYGVQKKSVTTAAISSVKASDFEKMTLSRVENVLRGQVSGVSITQQSGAPNSGLNIRVRGIGTTGDNNPLYIVDGMAVGGGIQNINPADIASIEILKDAASAAVYGARGGNGVIIITTKKGAAGKPTIKYEMNLGWQNPARKLPLLNSEEYMMMQNELAINNNAALPFTAQQVADARAGKAPNTDWQDIAFNENAPITNHQVSIQGGNEKATYYLSLGRFAHDGILGGNFGVSNYDRWTIRANNEYEIFKVESRNFLNRVRVGMNTTYSRANNTSIGNNDIFGTALASALAMPPNIAPYLSEEEGKALQAQRPTALMHDGKVLALSPVDFQEIRNPLAIYLRPNKQTNDEDKFVGSFWGEVDILPGLLFRSNFGFDLAFWGNEGYRFPYFQSFNTTGANDDDPAQSQAWAEMNRGFTRQIDNTLTYNLRINEHSLTLLAGQSAIDYIRKMTNARGYDLKAYDPHLAIINNALADQSAGGRNGGGTKEASALASYFGQISYNYAERYMLQATIRRDGSYKFGDNNKWGNFPSFSVGWNVWNEPYLQSAKPKWWDALKLRGSWGINGSDRIGDWAYMALMESNLNYYFSDELYTGISAGRLPNPNIQWEESRQTDLGFDAVFLRSSLTFTFDWYKKRTINMLRDAANVPGYTGQNAPRVNAGIVDNTGVDFDLGYRFSPVKDLHIGVRANASYNKNTIVDYGNATGENQVGGGIGAAGLSNFIYQRNGFPNPFYYGFVTDGILQTQAEADAYNTQFGTSLSPGDVKFKDISGPDGVPDGKITDGTATEPGDRTMIGKPVPDWTYGLTLTADYKGFDLYAFFQGVQGADVFDLTRRSDVPKANLTTEWLERWHGEGTSNTYPRLVSGNSNSSNWRASDLLIKDASFTRLKNLQIGYTLPRKITQIANVESLRIWIGGENLLTFTKYNGYDPEIGSENGFSRMGNYPQARTYNVGLGITF
ncbi:MAG: TonB-dependent receptor [Tannerella sp.]|jgi:TonB-linked SusC/RagA family outer membrane protein|nr:TonB-dependent receptor [Tannerella sp.]